jgi:hypothetical protein
MPFRSQLIFALFAAGVIGVALPAPGLAQRGGWGAPDGSHGWGSSTAGSGEMSFDGRDRSREGKITVARFVSDAPLAAQLGHGTIVVSANSPDALDLGQSDRMFEAAISARLVRAGYAPANPQSTNAQSAGGQVAELTVTRIELQPQEPPHKPVSGEMAVGAGSYGSGMSLALNVDMRKPLPPLISTRLEARIRDRTTNAILWEGRAEVATRPGTKGWSDQEIATRLAAALLEGFPHASDKLAPHGG